MGSQRCFSTLLFLLIMSPLYLAASTTEQLFISTLDYIGRDYRLAVQNGVVIDSFEYREMIDFSQQVQLLWDTLRERFSPQVQRQISVAIQKLTEEIQRKGAYDTVRHLAQEILLLAISSGLQIPTPQQWPSLTDGQRVYQQYCSSCHGGNGGGDGPQSRGLEPPPTNFLSADFQQLSSPLSAYNAIRLGIEGTAMQPFPNLTEKEAWAVAYYVKALPHLSAHRTVQRSIASIGDTLLEVTAKSSDQQLLQWLSSRFPQLPQDSLPVLLAGIRTYQPAADFRALFPKALQALQEIEAMVAEGKQQQAARQVLSLYLTTIEPMEQLLYVKSPTLTTKIENTILALRGMLERGEKEKALQSIALLRTQLQEARQVVNNDVFSFGLTFGMSLAIVFREGLEALLIILILLSIMRRLNADHLRHMIHAGWLSAIAFGCISWFFVDMIVQWGREKIEIFEGVGALLAVVILLYVGFWLHSTSTATGWQRFVKERMENLISQRNSIGLFFLSFIAVFREAVETVIFLSALSLETTATARSGIFAGIGIGALTLAILAFVLEKFSQKLPYRQLFRISAITMVILAVVLVGKGVHALQESGLVSVYPLPVSLNYPYIGLYASWETITAQFLVIVIGVILWKLSSKPRMSAA